MDRRKTILWTALTLLAILGPLFAIGGFTVTLVSLNFDFLVGTIWIAAATLLLPVICAALAK